MWPRLFELLADLSGFLVARALEILVFYYALQFVYYLYHRLLHNPISGPLYRMHHIGHHKKQFHIRRLRARTYGEYAACEDATMVAGSDESASSSKTTASASAHHRAVDAHCNNAPTSLRLSIARAFSSRWPFSTSSQPGAAEAPKTRANSPLQLKDGWFETGGELAFGVPATLVALLAMTYLPTWTVTTLVCMMVYVAVTGEVLHSSYHLYDDALSHPESLTLHRLLVGWPWFRRYQHLHDIHHARPGTNFGFFDFTMDRLFGTFEDRAPSYLVTPPLTVPHVRSKLGKDE